MKHQKFNMFALVVGPGAGSKYLHTLLDSHPEMYAIPGYCMMYFYPHYFDIYKSVRSNFDLINILLDRIPPIYDTRIMPGSETLDQLGEDGNEYMHVEKRYFLQKVLSYLPSSILDIASSADVLLALHKAHFDFFSTLIYNNKMPKNILYHIHCDAYLPFLMKDFPDSKIISMIRIPSVNISRRLRSSMLEADIVKLNALDYYFVKSSVISKISCYHFRALNYYAKVSTEIFFVDYQALVNDQINIVNSLLKQLGLHGFSDSCLTPTFAGKPHKLRFYEKHRNMTIETINSNSKSISSKPRLILDAIYSAKLEGHSIPFIIKFKYILETFMLRDYEKAELAQFFSLSSIFSYFNNISRVVALSPRQYDFLHGYFRFKWSTPQSYIKMVNFLNKPHLNSALSNFQKTNLILFYIAIYFVSCFAIFLSLFKRRYYQLMLLSLDPIQNGRLID
ncbi:sulfotransferase [Synechococcus sp. KORDI-100]|uniref:sulfotransferase n=1 Tax=Synechococcus sp. KORDI-100 TaxID=1280380 RepID=UPI000A7BE300|nr:sulfotransferase [Synechococcus sp. KORDI-100]